MDIKNHTYYFFDDIKFFDPIKIKIHEKSFENILIYYIRQVMIKDLKCVKIDIVNQLYLVINKVNGCFEEINENKYLMLLRNNESKEIMKNMKNYGAKSKI